LTSLLAATSLPVVSLNEKGFFQSGYGFAIHSLVKQKSFPKRYIFLLIRKTMESEVLPNCHGYGIHKKSMFLST
jgi:hypothetical protein